MKTIEAVVDKDGGVRLLSKVRVSRKRRALVTILDEEPRDASEGSTNEATSNKKGRAKLSLSDPSVREPTNVPVDMSEVLGLWADRKESALEIARNLRKANRRTT